MAVQAGLYLTFLQTMKTLLQLLVSLISCRNPRKLISYDATENFSSLLNVGTCILH